jgi:multiple sugar transport system substrate-binding protein
MSALAISRRRFLRGAGALGVMGALAACVPAGTTVGPSAPAADAGAAPAGEDTTVRLLTTHGATMAPFIEASLANFSTEHPGITVEHEDLTEGYYDRLNVMLASDTLPDVVNIRSFDMYDWYRLGNLHSVSPFLEADPDLAPEDLIDAIMQSCYYEGEYWGLPYDASVMIFFYNKNLLDAASVAPPADGWNWDSLVEIGQALTNEADQAYGLARFPGIKDWTLEPWILSNGAQMINEERTEWMMVGPEAEETLAYVSGRYQATAMRFKTSSGMLRPIPPDPLDITRLPTVVPM